jgi:hypothetical protein
VVATSAYSSGRQLPAFQPVHKTAFVRYRTNRFALIKNGVFLSFKALVAVEIARNLALFCRNGFFQTRIAKP